MMRTVMTLVLVVFSLIPVSGCKSSAMVKVADEAAIVPTADSAVVVFVRPSPVGYAYQSVVYETTTKENQLVGIVSSGARVAYRTTPGTHMFMVVSEAADFLQATVEANKTYYVRVTPRFGVFRARFSLDPVRAEEFKQPEFGFWGGLEWYENTDASREWAKNNAASVQSKREEYFKKWSEKSAEDKAEATLLPGDHR